MDDLEEPYSGILARLRPALEPVFAAYGVSAPEAEAMLTGAGEILLLLRVPVEDAQGWLVRAVVERCQRLHAERKGGRL